jgi:hypothetical protein
MIQADREEREWLLTNIALALVEYMGVAEPPVPVEELLKIPPDIYRRDFGVVDLYSNLWDATFARPLSRQGSIFVRMDLAPEDRRFALARETLCAIITSKHGQALGLGKLLMPELRESAEFFARALLAPGPMVYRYRKNNGKKGGFAKTFELNSKAAELRWQDPISEPC